MIGVISAAHRRHGAEKFVAECGHTRRYVSNHRRLEEISFIGAACQQPRARHHCILDLSFNHRALARTDQRPDHRVRIAWVADFERPRLGHEFLKESLIDRRFDDNSRPRHADLALVDENAEAGRIHGIVEIRVL